MNKLKKIGLTALAGSLVAFSANAVEMSVSGNAEVTYTTNNGTIGAETGNPFGANTAISFSGSGDVGFGTATIVRTLNDNNPTTYLSAYQTVDLGDMGIVSFDSKGGGLVGLTANDDLLPTAYEEVWNGVAGAGVTGGGSSDNLGYRNTFGAISVSAGYYPGGTGGSADGENDGAGSTGSGKDIYLSADMSDFGAPGLTVGAGIYRKDDTQGDTIADDGREQIALVKYSSGPVTVGVTMSDATGGTITNLRATEHHTQAASIAFAVNDALSISYARQDKEFDKSQATNVTEEVKAFNASYTLGAASIRATLSESDNDNGVTGDKDEHMEISLVLAF
jgi:outer membrane protein OmpU